MFRYLNLAVVLIFAASATAASQESATYVRAGRLLDVSSGELLADRLIQIEDGRVVAIGDATSMAVPEGPRVIDLAGATVLPGLIDAHVHLTKSSRLRGYRGLGRSSIRAALFGVAAARRTLRAGFTTVRNLSASDFGDVALRDAIEDGDVIGPRMLVSGPSLGMTGGHCDNNLLPPEMEVVDGGVADGPWAVRERVRNNVKYGADVIKFCATGGVTSKGTELGAQQYTLEEMEAVVSEARALGRRVAAHAHGTPGIRSAILAGVNSVEHASILDEETIEMARSRGTVFVMDVYVSDYILEAGTEAGFLEESLAKEREVGQVQRDNFRRAVEGGVRMAFGSDAGVYPHGQNGRQFAYMVEYGMSPIEAIQAATVNAADLLGLDDEVGQLRPGFQADLIAVRGNPLEDVRLLEDVGFVMKGGTVYLDDLSNGGPERLSPLEQE